MRDIITKLEQLNVEKEQLNEGLADMAHEAEKDHEVQMARSDCYKSAKYAVAIHKMLKDVSEMEGIDGWVAAKITKAADYLGSVKHYMEGQAMSDVELAVVPVAGDMTDAMTVPQESVEEVHEAEEHDYICVHAKKGKYECSGTSSYAAAKKAAEHWGLKSTAGIDAHLADEKKTATESIEVNEASREELIDATIEQIKKDLARGDVTALEMMLMALDPRDLEAFASEADFDDMMDDVEVAEGRLGFSDLEKFGSEMASKIDMEARRRGSADMEPGDADELRYKIAKEMGLVESQVVENAERIIKVSNIDYAGPALDKLPTETTLKLNIPYDADEDDVYDMVADELEDRHGVKVDGFDMNFAESVEEDEDIIGNIIGKLAQTKAGQRGGKDVIGDIIAKLPKDSDEKTVNMPSLPKSKPERTPTVSAVAQQAAANKAVRSMAQDTTRPLRQSKFSEWSKK